MYTIDIHHKGDEAPTTYTIFNENEAKEKKIEYKYWRDADEGEYGISDDNYVAKVISKSIYKPTSIYVRFPYGYTFITLSIIALLLKLVVENPITLSQGSRSGKF